LIVFSHGSSSQGPKSHLETIKAPFGTKISTDFDAPDVNLDLYADDFHSPDIGKWIQNILVPVIPM
jgi:hypothetical protein